MALALRAEITAEEYAELRVQALKAGCSTQEYVGRVLRRALTKGEGSFVSVGGADPNVPAVENDVHGEVEALVGNTRPSRAAHAPSLKLYARAGCPYKVAEGVRCEGCGAVHQA